MNNIKQIINSSIKNTIDKQTVIDKIADLKGRLKIIKNQGKYDEFGLLLDKKEKTKQIKNSIKLLEDLKKDLQINSINQTYLENFGTAKVKGNGIKALNYKDLEKNIKLKIGGEKYIISSYIEVIRKEDLGENLDKENIKIFIVNGIVYEFFGKNKELIIKSKRFKVENMKIIYGNGKNFKQKEKHNIGKDEKIKKQEYQEYFIDEGEIAETEARGNEMIEEMIEKIKLRNKIKIEMKNLYDTNRDKYETLKKIIMRLNHELRVLKINASPDEETRKYYIETVKENIPNIDEYLEEKLKEIGGEELVDVLSFKDGIDINKINQRKLKYNFFNNLSPEDQEKIHQLFRKLYKFGEDNFLFRFIESNSINTHLDIFDAIL